MSVDRALEVLGLSGSPTQDEIRRAYLRKVREHPPERDRDGFVLVREAFDFLKSGIIRMSWAQPEPEPESESEPEAESESESESESEAESEAEAESESFGGDFQEQLDLLNEALSSDDPVAAARAMGALYARPILEAGPIPPPLFCLQTFMLLVERGHFQEAHQLLAAFGQHAALHRLEAGFGSGIGARWRLACEVSALADIDEELASAMAGGLRSDNLGAAARKGQQALRRGVELPRLMSAQTPTLWSMLGPLLHVPEPEARTFRSRGGGLGAWPIGVIVMVLFNVARLCAPSGGSTSHSERYTPSVQQVSSAESESESQQPNWVEMSPEAVRLSFRERAEQMAEKQWQSIKGALLGGDCQDVATRWPLYRQVAPDDVVDPATTAARKKQILEMCAELQPLLEDKP